MKLRKATFIHQIETCRGNGAKMNDPKQALFEISEKLRNIEKQFANLRSQIDSFSSFSAASSNIATCNREEDFELKPASEVLKDLI